MVENNINTQDRRRRRTYNSYYAPSSHLLVHTLRHADKRNEMERVIHAVWYPLPCRHPSVLVEVVFAASSKRIRRVRVRDSLHFNSPSLTVYRRAQFYAVVRKTAGLQYVLCSRHLTTCIDRYLLILCSRLVVLSKRSPCTTNSSICLRIRAELHLLTLFLVRL